MRNLAFGFLAFVILSCQKPTNQSATTVHGNVDSRDAQDATVSNDYEVLAADIVPYDPADFTVAVDATPAPEDDPENPPLVLEFDGDNGDSLALIGSGGGSGGSGGSSQTLVPHSGDSPKSPTSPKQQTSPRRIDEKSEVKVGEGESAVTLRSQRTLVSARSLLRTSPRGGEDHASEARKLAGSVGSPEAFKTALDMAPVAKEMEIHVRSKGIPDSLTSDSLQAAARHVQRTTSKRSLKISFDSVTQEDLDNLRGILADSGLPGEVDFNSTRGTATLNIQPKPISLLYRRFLTLGAKFRLPFGARVTDLASFTKAITGGTSYEGELAFRDVGRADVVAPVGFWSELRAGKLPVVHLGTRKSQSRDDGPKRVFQRTKYSDKAFFLKTEESELAFNGVEGTKLAMNIDRDAVVKAFGTTPEGAKQADGTYARQTAVYEYIEGQSIAEALVNKTMPTLEEPAIARGFRRQFNLLKGIHAKKFYLRDLKSDNIMLTVENGEYAIRLYDLGSYGKEGVTTGAHGARTRNYVPNGYTSDGRDDLFAFAHMLFEVQLGMDPLIVRQEIRKTHTALTGFPDTYHMQPEWSPALGDFLSSRSDLSDKQKAFFMKALSFDPEQRFQTDDDFDKAVVDAGLLPP